MPMEYAIIAAGKGERLAQEGASAPKPLTLLNGEPMIDRLLRFFTGLGAGRIHVIVNESSPALVGHLKDWQMRAPVHLVVKNTESSLHSFAALVASGIRGEVCLTTVDTVFKEDEFRSLIQSFRAKPHLDGLMAVTSFVDDEKPLYVRTGDRLKITAFEDSPSAGTSFVSGGIYCLRQRALDLALSSVDLHVSRMRNYQRALLERGLSLEAFPFSRIVDVDHLTDIAVAEELLNTGLIKDPTITTDL